VRGGSRDTLRSHRFWEGPRSVAYKSGGCGHRTPNRTCKHRHHFDGKFGVDGSSSPVERSATWAVIRCPVRPDFGQVRTTRCTANSGTGTADRCGPSTATENVQTPVPRRGSTRVAGGKRGTSAATGHIRVVFSAPAGAAERRGNTVSDCNVCRPCRGGRSMKRRTGGVAKTAPPPATLALPLPGATRMLPRVPRRDRALVPEELRGTEALRGNRTLTESRPTPASSPPQPSSPPAVAAAGPGC